MGRKKRDSRQGEMILHNTETCPVKLFACTLVVFGDKLSCNMHVLDHGFQGPIMLFLFLQAL